MRKRVMGTLGIAIIDRGENERLVNWYDPETGKWRRVPLVPNRPTITFDIEDAVEVYKELHNFFSSRGYKNKDESFREGELTGTKKHLEDLRHLLKLPPKKDG